MKFLFVGDPHVRKDDLEDCQNLVDYVYETAMGQEVDAIVWLGDLHHNFGIVNIGVTDFWLRTFKRFGLPHLHIHNYAIVGNHDIETNGDRMVHALLPYKELENVTVVDNPTTIFGEPDILFLPYMRNEEFVQTCNESNAKIVICHQEFDGCQYENGFYSKHGVNPNSIPQELVISGHIHMPQTFGKVMYLGSPRWITASDANQDRFIYVWDTSAAPFGPDSSIPWRPFKTSERLRRIEEMTETPEKLLGADNLNPNWAYTVNLVGPEAWVRSRQPFWKGKRVKVRSLPLRDKAPAVRESEGIDTSFKKYSDGFTPKYGSDKSDLEKLVQEKVYGIAQEYD
jgi:DNA repair exonuclease SbcCD nuclease subunit